VNAHRRLLGALVVLGITGLRAAPAYAYTVETLQHTGPSANRLDLVILGDGYTAQGQAKMTSDAEDVLRMLFARGFWAAYENYVNVKLVHVVSNEAGADNGQYGSGVLRDTALGATFNCEGFDRLLCVDDALVEEVADAHQLEHDHILVLVNDLKYGGGGGVHAVVSMAYDGQDSAIHELGHSLFGLADEYENDAYWPRCDAAEDCPEVNVTTKTALADVKWSHWIEAGTPIPATPPTATYASTVGLFEGARYYPDGQYRPWLNCLMRSLGQGLCPVCAERSVLVMNAFAGLEDSHSPDSSSVSLTTAESTVFSVSGPRPTPNTVSAKWYKNGNPLSGFSRDSVSVSGSTLGVGTHELRVDLKDDTAFVRKDPEGALSASRTWTVTVTSAEGGMGGAGSGGFGGAASGGSGSGGDASGGSSGAGGDTSLGGLSSSGGVTASGGVVATGGVSSTGGSAQRSGDGDAGSDEGGCSCSTTKQPSTHLPALMGLGLVLLAAHRRARAVRS
jgi:MYXO-CTERM domain-containing protein